MADTVLIPPKRGEFFTPNGIPTHRFITWIESLTTNSNTNTSNIEINTTEITNISVRESYPWPTTQPYDEIKEFEYPTLIPEVKQFNAVTTSINYTSVDHDFINATNGSTVTFPKYPNENSVIIVRNGDGSTIKLNGNGKNLNGSSTGVLRRKSTSIEFYYFIESDEWFAR